MSDGAVRVSDSTSPPTQYGDYAGSVTRLVAFLIDGLIIITLVTGTWLISSFLGGFLRVNEMTHRLLQIFTIFSVIGIQAGYFILLWMLAGVTIGKRVMGLVVVSKDGGSVSFGMALRRYIGYYISAVFMLGYIWIIFDARRQGWHDKLAGTFVLYDWPDSVLLARASGEATPTSRRASARPNRRLQDAQTGLPPDHYKQS